MPSASLPARYTSVISSLPRSSALSWPYWGRSSICLEVARCIDYWLHRCQLMNWLLGKRRNVLRNRTDSWDYDMDQLLLGTILFTLVTFLFPTVIVYYLLFALVSAAGDSHSSRR